MENLLDNLLENLQENFRGIEETDFLAIFLKLCKKDLDVQIEYQLMFFKGRKIDAKIHKGV